MASADPAIYRTILQNMGDGVLTLDMAGTITTLNPAAAAILALDPEETVGARFAEIFFADEAFEAFSELVLKAIYEAEATHSEEIVLSRGGSERHLQVSTTYMKDPGGDGANLGVIVVVTDLSERHKRRKIKRLMAQYIDPRVVGLMLSDGAAMRGADRREMSVLFCDMAGFTALTEHLETHRLLDLLNAYLTMMSEAIGEAGGITDKYIGDAVMAYWGVPFHAADEHAALACRAALAQQARLGALRALVAERAGLADGGGVDIRIGIASGLMVAGDVGPANARNFTVIGDAVNVASRLETANKIYGTRILTTAETRAGAGAGFLFRAVDTLRLRGRDRPEDVYELLGDAASADPALSRLGERYEAALAAYRTGSWDVARAGFEGCLALVPGDRPSHIMRARIARLEGGGVLPGWDGLWPHGVETL
jgi:PAS domain S-box-containing protein